MKQKKEDQNQNTEENQQETTDTSQEITENTQSVYDQATDWTINNDLGLEYSASQMFIVILIQVYCIVGMQRQLLMIRLLNKFVFIEQLRYNQLITGGF